MNKQDCHPSNNSHGCGQACINISASLNLIIFALQNEVMEGKQPSRESIVWFHQVLSTDKKVSTESKNEYEVDFI